jgi:hypothetical protein
MPYALHCYESSRKARCDPSDLALREYRAFSCEGRVSGRNDGHGPIPDAATRVGGPSRVCAERRGQCSLDASQFGDALLRLEVPGRCGIICWSSGVSSVAEDLETQRRRTP